MREGPGGAGGFSVLPETLSNVGDRISSLAGDVERLAGSVLEALATVAPALGDAEAEGLCNQLTTDLTKSFGGLGFLSQRVGAVTTASAGAYEEADAHIAGLAEGH